MHTRAMTYFAVVARPYSRVHTLPAPPGPYPYVSVHAHVHTQLDTCAGRGRLRRRTRVGLHFPASLPPPRWRPLSPSHACAQDGGRLPSEGTRGARPGAHVRSANRPPPASEARALQAGGGRSACAPWPPRTGAILDSVARPAPRGAFPAPPRAARGPPSSRPAPRRPQAPASRPSVAERSGLVRPGPGEGGGGVWE